MILWTRRNVGLVVPRSDGPQILSIHHAVAISDLTVPKRTTVLMAPCDWAQGNFLDQPSVKERMFACAKASVFRRQDATFKLVANDIVSPRMLVESFPSIQMPNLNDELIRVDCVTASELLPQSFAKHQYPVICGHVTVPRTEFIRALLGRFERHVASLAKRFLTEEATRQLNGKRRPSRAHSETFAEPPCFTHCLERTRRIGNLTHEQRFQLAKFVNSFPDEPMLDTAKERLGDSASDEQFKLVTKFSRTTLPMCRHMGEGCPGMCHSLGPDATPVDVAYAKARGPKRPISIDEESHDALKRLL